MITNKKIYHKFFIEKEFEAGMILKGWEVKSLRAKKVNINDCYIFFRNREIYSYGIKFIPLYTTERNRIYSNNNEHKFLLKSRELDSIYGYVSKKGCRIVLISLYWKYAWAKAKIAIAKNKKKYDKRNSFKKEEWKIYRKEL